MSDVYKTFFPCQTLFEPAWKCPSTALNDNLRIPGTSAEEIGKAAEKIRKRIEVENPLIWAVKSLQEDKYENIEAIH